MKRAIFITLLISLAIWLAGCEVVETHYVGRHHGFYGPPPAVVYQAPAYPPPRYYGPDHVIYPPARRPHRGPYGH